MQLSKTTIRAQAGLGMRFADARIILAFLACVWLLMAVIALCSWVEFFRESH